MLSTPLMGKTVGCGFSILEAYNRVEKCYKLSEVNLSYGDILSHWGRDQIDAISQTTFSNAFWRMKKDELRLGFHWNLFLRFELTIFQHWFRKWLGAGQGTNHYLNQWWVIHWRIYASLGLNELIMIKVNTQRTLALMYVNAMSRNEVYSVIKRNMFSCKILWLLYTIIILQSHKG